MLKKYYVTGCGNKELTVKRDRKKIPIQYQTRDLFTNNQDAVICGYVDLKRKISKRRKSTGILCSGELDVSPIYESKGSMRSIKGYIDVGGDNFIAIERKNPLILILPLLFVLLAICLLCFFYNIPPDRTPDAWTPKIDDNIGNYENPIKNYGSQIKIAGFSSWMIPANETESIPINLKNPQGNPCYFSFTLILPETNQVLYQSDMVPPGNAIRQISISEPLPMGTYKAVIHIETNELGTGRKMNSADLKLTIIAN